MARRQREQVGPPVMHSTCLAQLRSCAELESKSGKERDREHCIEFFIEIPTRLSGVDNLFINLCWRACLLLKKQ